MNLGARLKSDEDSSDDGDGGCFLQRMSILVCHRRNDLPEQAIGFFSKTGKDSDKGLFANIRLFMFARRQKKPAKGRANMEICNNQRGGNDVVIYKAQYGPTMKATPLSATNHPLYLTWPAMAFDFRALLHQEGFPEQGQNFRSLGCFNYFI
jgi:hypothetical protein